MRELVLFNSSPLEGALLMGLEALSLNGDLGALERLMMPSLKRLHTRCPGQEETLLRTLAGARWWASLTTWTHHVQSKEGLAALLQLRPLVARGGRGFTALCEQALLELVSPELQRALPHAQFKLMPMPTPPFDPEDREGPPRISVMPSRTDFRELAGWVITSERSTQSEHGTDNQQVGPGVPFENNHRFHACGWCASSDTRHTSGSHSALYSHFETTNYDSWGYECMDCGVFTSMSSVHTR